jgi:peptidoglycan/LPS O-acetylase OafA/YrhL
MLAYPHLPLAARYIPVTALVLASLPFVFARSRDSAVDRWLGELSYPFYLLHLPVLNAVGGTLASILCTLGGAALIHVTLQRPLEGVFKRGSHARIGGAMRLPAAA